MSQQLSYATMCTSRYVCLTTCMVHTRRCGLPLYESNETTHSNSRLVQRCRAFLDGANRFAAGRRVHNTQPRLCVRTSCTYVIDSACLGECLVKLPTTTPVCRNTLPKQYPSHDILGVVCVDKMSCTACVVEWNFHGTDGGKHPPPLWYGLDFCLFCLMCLGFL
jgi:hypothetical protein